MGGYKEHKLFDMLKRRSVIIKYIFFIVLIFIITASLIISAIAQRKTKDIVYTENSKLDYKVYLKENEFFKKDYLEENNQYIASLIDYISANFHYNLSSEDKDVAYKYTYKVTADVDVLDKKTKNPLFQYTENLLDEKECKGNTNTTLSINEPIRIDYNKYNDIVNRFLVSYDLTEVVPTVTVKLYVNLEDNESAKKAETPVASLTIPLTTKTMAIDMESNSVNGNDINVTATINDSKYIFLSVLLILIDIFLVCKLVRFIKDTKDQKSVYNMELRKIMSNYGSYIQKLNNELTFDDCQILEIKSFEDLLQIRETINKPILMTEKASAMETYFFIPNDKDVYVYEFKAGNLRKRRGTRYKEKEEIES